MRERVAWALVTLQSKYNATNLIVAHPQINLGIHVALLRRLDVPRHCGFGALMCVVCCEKTIENRKKKNNNKKPSSPAPRQSPCCSRPPDCIANRHRSPRLRRSTTWKPPLGPCQHLHQNNSSALTWIERERAPALPPIGNTVNQRMIN